MHKNNFLKVKFNDFNLTSNVKLVSQFILIVNNVVRNVSVPSYVFQDKAKATTCQK